VQPQAIDLPPTISHDQEHAHILDHLPEILPRFLNPKADPHFLSVIAHKIKDQGASFVISIFQF
jgi:hypothetical protein